MSDIDEYLRPYRREVLVVIRWSAVLTTLMLFLISMVPKGLGNIEASNWALLGVSLSYCLVCFLIRERNIRLQATISSVVMFAVCVLLLYSTGPIYSVGILTLAWVAWVVFFHNQLLLPLIMAVVYFASVAIAESLSLTPAWPFGDVTVQQWLGMLIVPFFPMAGGAYLLQQMIFGLIRSLVRESAARKRELDIQREKELIDRALMQRYRLESLGRLASGVAHDFNNILTVLMSCLEVLRVVNDKPTREGVLNDMEAAVRSAEATSRQLLTLSSNNGSASDPADPRTSLRSLIANLKRLFPENIVVEEYVRGTPRVAVQTGEFEQMILNLCINARDSMMDGGLLTINCFEQPGEDLVIVEIADTGSGMSEEILAKAIDPFFTTKVEREGTGLGLSQVYGALQNVGGDIEIQSTPGIGTRVRLLLPVAEPVQVAVTARVEDVSGGQDKKILLLDDDQLVANTMSRALASAGYDVTSAISVSEAMGRLSEQSFQILITDRGLPDGDPNRVVEKFKEMSDGPVLLISGYETDDPLDERVSFLQKPFAPSTLLRKLTELNVGVLS